MLVPFFSSWICTHSMSGCFDATWLRPSFQSSTNASLALVASSAAIAWGGMNDLGMFTGTPPPRMMPVCTNRYMGPLLRLTTTFMRPSTFWLLR